VRVDEDCKTEKEGTSTEAKAKAGNEVTCVPECDRRGKGRLGKIKLSHYYHCYNYYY